MRTGFNSSRRKRKKLPEEMTLQITSMADIFVILLVFLLKSYSNSIVNLSPTEGNTLPEAVSSAQIKETLKVEVKSDQILVDQKPVMKLANFVFNAPEDQGDEDSPSEKLFEVLQEQRRPNPVPNQEPNLLVMADQKTPYTTLKKVLASAAKAGFVDLQLVVVNPD